MRARGWIPVGLLVLGALAGCNQAQDIAAPRGTPRLDAAPALVAGAVYTMTNAAAGNAVLAFSRDASGALTAAGSYATGGMGTGAGLGNQGGMTLTQDGRWLLVVNAGSNDVSVMAVGHDGLTVADVQPSGGTMPISVTVHGRLVYVLNAGGAGGIAGFWLGNDGSLQPIAGSTQGLGGAAGPAQVGFSPDGSTLVVTAKATNQLVSYRVGAGGAAGAPMLSVSSGATPFGFAFTRQGTVVVSEAQGAAANASTISSYSVAGDGTLTPITSALADDQTAACWIVITPNNHFAYTTNAGSGTVSGFDIASDGALSLLGDSGVAGDTGTGSSPIDAAITPGGRHLYVLAAGTGAISVFSIGADGGLTSLPGPTGLPAGLDGLAAR